MKDLFVMKHLFLVKSAGEITVHGEIVKTIDDCLVVSHPDATYALKCVDSITPIREDVLYAQLQCLMKKSDVVPNDILCVDATLLGNGMELQMRGTEIWCVNIWDKDNYIYGVLKNSQDVPFVRETLLFMNKKFEEKDFDTIKELELIINHLVDYKINDEFGMVG